MNPIEQDREQVFVILRADLFQSAGTPLETSITVKEVVRTLEVAEREVVRLNGLHPDGQVRYWLAPSRLFAPGRSAGSGAQPA